MKKCLHLMRPTSIFSSSPALWASSPKGEEKRNSALPGEGKRKMVFCFLLLYAGFCGAQNLVPNPSFEDTVGCPDFPGQVWRAQGWYIASATPDYYHCCCNSTHPVCGVPNNIFSFRYAATGIAYCGLWVYLNLNPPPDFQERIGVGLTSPMEIGTRYYVSMKVSSVSSNHDEPVNGAIDKLGMLFSTTKYDLSNLPPYNNYAQCYSDSIVTDTVGWVNIKGNFVADSAYTFLTIGNFFDNGHVNSVRYWYLYGDSSNPGILAYYFIDDICVSTDSSGCDFSPFANLECDATGTQSSIVQNNFLLYQNPADNYLSIKTETESSALVEFCNHNGQILARQKIPRGQYLFNEDVSQLANGIYFIKLITDYKILSQKIIIQH